uniref:LisH domain-containing protein n=1 Tax=Anopheles christyi TaxID=43041 RepID=A0A182JTK2_9DIPT
MERQYNEAAARAVLGYLYDHDMYMLAEQFCIDCPYLGMDQSTFERGRIPVNVLQKPLEQVMKEFIAMQSQLLQLVNICSSVVAFPHTDSPIVLVGHLINVLKSSGTGQVFDAVISTLPSYNGWDDSTPHPPSQPPPPDTAPRDEVQNMNASAHNSTVSSLATDTLHSVNASVVSPNESITRCVEPQPIPMVVEKLTEPINISTFQNSPVNGKRITPDSIPSPGDKQSNPPANNTNNPTVTLSPHCTNHPNKPPVSVTLKPSQETELLATTNPPKVTSVRNEPTSENTRTLHGVTIVGVDPPRSNATPLDNPILPGTASSRSTSSRKRTHIRILDFGTPPFKRDSPATAYCSSANRQPSPPPMKTPYIHAIPVLKFPPSAERSLEQQRRSVLSQPPVQTEQLKPKKVNAKRRLKRLGLRKRSKRTVSSITIKNKLVAETILRTKKLTPKAVPRQPDTPFTSCQPSATKLVQGNHPKDEPASSSSINYVSPIRSTTSQLLHNTKEPSPTKEGPVVRPLSGSPPRALMPPGSPGCPVDPLAIYPMTPRFLTRPLQPLCMLSPLLGPLDLSSISQIKSISHTKPSDINTPCYPITPGCAITPSPPPDSVSYYEGKPPPPVCTGREGNRAEDEAYDSEPSEEANGASREPQLTLTTNDEEITIRYQEGQRQLGPLRERDSEYDERLASRIEIDNGHRVFQIAISPIINLFEK